MFGAISHPARRRMLDLLVETDRSAGAIAGHFQMSRPAVSQHLRVLLDAGLVLRLASNVKASFLILNGAKDDRTVPSQARNLAEQIARNGGTARAIIYPDFGHKIPVDVRNKDIDPFIDSVLRGSPLIDFRFSGGSN